MAGNHYRQQWPQNPGPSYEYDPRDDQRQWQENARGQAPYNQDYQRYNDYPNSRNGYGPEPGTAPMNYDQNPHWQGQNQYLQNGYHNQYYENGNGYSQAPYRDQFDQGPPPNRTYQYDDRYRTNGRDRPPMDHHGSSGYSNGQKPPRGQRSEPPTQKRPKPRERILTEPTSPKNLAWDNPFGVFPPKKKQGDMERHSSLDHGMNHLNLNERRHSGGPESRPHTSHDQRGPPRKEVPRPGTSHDRHPDMGRPPPQDYRMPLGQNSPEMNRQQPNFRPQGRNSPEMNRQRPNFRPPGGMASPPVRPPRQDPPREPPAGVNPDPSLPRPYGGLDGYNSQGTYRSQGNYDAQNHYRDDYGMQNEGYAQDYIPSSRPYESPIDGPQSRNPPRQAFDEDYHANAYRELPSTDSSGHQKTRTNEMPNFDAIPTRANEKSEDHMNTGPQQSFDQQIYRKPTYQVPGGFPNQIDTTNNKPPPLNNTTSPLAEFSFDLPPSTNGRSVTPGRSELPAQGAPYRQDHGGQGSFDSRPTARTGYEVNRPGPASVSQYPPRAASRNGMKPSMGQEIPRPPPVPTSAQGYQSFSQDQYPGRPHTSNAQRLPPQSYDVGNPYDQERTPETRAPSAPAAPGAYQPGYNDPGPDQPYRPGYGQGPPPRAASQDNYNPGGPRPNTSNSAHPVPIRHYGDSNANSNPDALPAHPTPVRPGLNNNISNGYGTSQPPPTQSGQKREVTGPVPNQANGRNSPPVTTQELNGLREMYNRNPADYALGLKLAKKMVEAARVLADENGTADTRQTQKNRERYIFDAHKLVKKLVAANSTEAMFYLADCHGQGLLGLPVDPKEAFHLYQSAAKLNHAESAYRVAVCCELGSEEGGGTRRDPMKAIQWYKRAATLGDTPAMYKMGMILLKGLLGQQKNPREAISWLKRAAERADKNNPHALHELGLLYESATPNDVVIRDEKYAFQLFQQAAELGYKYSQFRLGSAFEYGLLGCPIDARQSIAWYTRAAAQGEHQSELALSGWYLTGSEPLLTQSDTEAFLWARKAASSGLAKAEYAMGYFNEVGIGTAADIEEAKRWYYRAAAQNFIKARERLEELKRGGQKMQKTRVSRSHMNRHSDGECVVM
ncbi:uncharacterized protein Z518_01420 [Rhinocladiella mackenziei CBS 650.93]|uniref:Chitin synthase activator (Chs3) n=1 Tax=Rhinocladiella mackenziei CBS 650.93 TaxID=1442369 RepID=A0A0D2HI15_9EURO|nr:uncharacterized protein Z518_01420 [Rhinocladiella mackenziei CBS 650.93]KIX10338.1 hypothetical protein Z518_01420 [Rhinocladiella mackenziei CBS 650.93]